MEKVKGLVSVIVPNHGRDVTALIDSVKRSTYRPIEILVIDRGKERSAQRNIGIQLSRGEFLLFLDSDQGVSPDLIWECVFRMEFADAIYIPEIIVAKGLFGYIRRWERQFYTGTAVDVVKFIRASKCPYFDESMSGPEDSDWDRRVFGERSISFSAIYHNDQIKLTEYLRKKAYYSKSMRQYANKWSGDKCLKLWYRCLWIFMENGKWEIALSRPDLFLCVLFLLLLRGIVYYANR